jgi:hypothetical protein
MEQPKQNPGPDGYELKNGGIIIRNVETYVGYEYFDIGSTQTNSLMAGIRIWF